MQGAPYIVFLMTSLEDLPVHLPVFRNADDAVDVVLTHPIVFGYCVLMQGVFTVQKFACEAPLLCRTGHLTEEGKPRKSETTTTAHREGVE